MHGRRARVAASCACAVAWRTRHGDAYNEEAFRHFLALERARLRRFGRPFVVLLARGRDGAHATMDPVLARDVFRTLERTLRETDLVGWYRQGRVAAALLTELGAVAVPDVAVVVHRRVMASLDVASARVAHRLQVRVYVVLRAPGGAGELIVRGV